MAEAEATSRRASGGTTNPYASLPLLEAIPRLSPTFTAPVHLRAIAERLEAARHTPQRVVFAAPPRHAKTETVLHAIALDFAHDPTLQAGYASYSQAIALTKARRARSLTRAAGIDVGQGDASDAASEWETAQGGSLRSDGILGSWTGRGFARLHIDDPFKNRLEAESATIRDRVYDGWQSDLRTRLEPGASVFVYATRWHPDDLSGRLVRDGFDYVVLPAIDDVTGAALWPERWPAESLEAIRRDVGEYTWASLYQGRPRPRGGTVFGDPHTYDTLPREGLRYAVGVDLAYSSKTHADYSVAVLMAREDVPANGVAAHTRYYIVAILRVQEAAPAFGARLRALYAKHPTAARRAYLAGTEKGTADFLAAQGVNVGALPPTGDKFIRAQPLAAAWNAGAVLWPKDGGDLPEAALPEILSFTGVNDSHDDVVDAMDAAFDVLSAPIMRPSAMTSQPRQSTALFRGTTPGGSGSWRGGGA